MSRIYESLFRQVLFPLYESTLRRRNTLRYLKEYEDSQWLDAERVEEIQWRKLQELIGHCWENVPYYRRSWSELGISNPGDIASKQDFARLPVLDKPTIRANFEQLIASNYRDKVFYKATGGSTGEPLRFGYTRESYERRLAIMWRGYGWSGTRLGQRTLYLWGVPGRQKYKDRLYHAAFNRHMLSAFAMSESRMAEYADAIDRFRPETIVSYVAPIVRLSEWLLANGRKLWRPQRVLGAAEALHESQRELIERAFGCPAYNTYGCREFMLIAAECEHREGLHVNADHLCVELSTSLGSDGHGPHDIVVTDLHNYGMPLLRYMNGDLATPGGQRCSCGRGLPLLSSVGGRRLDALRTPAGRYIPGEHIVYAFLGATGIRRYQIVQKRLDAFDITLVRDCDFDESVIELMRHELIKIIGEDVTLNFHYADDLPLTPSGKHRVTISEVQ